MTRDAVMEHDGLFTEAMALLKGRILLAERPSLDMAEGEVAAKSDRAATLLTRVVELNPANWSAMWFLGKIFQRKRQMALALSWFARVRAIDPGNSDAAREGSICAMEIGNVEAAVALAKAATEGRQADMGLRANLALAFLLAGRLNDAENEIRQALADGVSDPISSTVAAMIEHFKGTGRTPPSRLSVLLEEWKARSKAKER